MGIRRFRCSGRVVLAAEILLMGAAMGAATFDASASSSAGGAWIPFQATPRGGSSAGKTGLLVVPSDSTQAVPTAIFLNDRAKNNYLAAGTNTKNYGKSAQSSALGAILYSSVGSDGKLHLYGANLSNTADIPREKQVSSFAAPASDVICLLGAAQSELADPTTLFVVVDVAGASGCFQDGSDEILLVHYNDSAATAPTHPAIVPAYPVQPMFPLYDSQGDLGGILYLDGSNKELKFFVQGDFTRAKAIASAVSNYHVPLAAPNASSTSVVINFESSPSALYSITPAGSATRKFKLAGSDSIALDAVNVYSLKHVFGGTAGDTYTISQQSLTGDGASIELFNGFCKNVFDLICDYGDILYSAGSAVVFEYTIGGADTTVSYELLSVPVGVNDGPVTLITQEESLEGFGDREGLYLASPTASPAHALMYLSTFDMSIQLDNSQFAQVLNASGTALITDANARFPYSTINYGWVPSPSLLDAPETLELSGLPAPTYPYTDGGGIFSAVNTKTLAKRTLTTPDLKPYVVPSGYSLTSASPVLNGTLGAGSFRNSFDTGNLPAMGAVFDLARAVIIPVGFEKTNVVPMF